MKQAIKETPGRMKRLDDSEVLSVATQIKIGVTPDPDRTRPPRRQSHKLGMAIAILELSVIIYLGQRGVSEALTDGDC
jgi:hypothetical protein